MLSASRRFRPLVFAGFVVVCAPATGAQAPAAPSCDALLLAARDVNGKKVGPASCLQIETPVTLDGRALTRLDLGIDGTVDGYITKTGDYKEYLTNAPDLVFGQTLDTGERFLGIARYER